MVEVNPGNIKKIQTFGAQCSGTNWVDGLLQQNLKNVEIMRTNVNGGNDTFGWKHGPLGKETRTYMDGREVKHKGERIVWTRKGIDISDRDPKYTGRDSSGDLYMKNHAIPLNNGNSFDKLLVVVSRNPMSWIQSYHQTPHHALEMYGVSFGEYIRKRPFRQYASVYLGAINGDTPEAKEARGYWINRGALLDTDESVFDHRSRSLDTFQAFADQVQNVVFVPYEKALADPQGTLTEIAGVYGIQMEPEFRGITAYKQTGNQEFAGSKYAPVEPDDLDYVIEHLAWDTERTAGFTLLDNSGNYSTEQLNKPARLVYVDPTVRYYKNGQLVAA